MRTVQTLIDEAINLCGSAAELARRIDVDRAEVTKWSNGDATITAETVALLCDVLELSGEETRRLAAEAIVANPKNAKRREALRRAFFVSGALGAVAFSLLAFPPSSYALTRPIGQLLAMQYTSCAIVRWLAKLARAYGLARPRPTTTRKTATPMTIQASQGPSSGSLDFGRWAGMTTRTGFVCCG